MKVAAKKRAADMAKIREEWRLPQSTLDEAKKRVCIAGQYIESLLDVKTRWITSKRVIELMAMVARRELSAEDLVTAFCKRAAFAHQLVFKLACNSEAALTNRSLEWMPARNKLRDGNCPSEGP
jgi:hypothetical protein